jgi:hypothetical protein
LTSPGYTESGDPSVEAAIQERVSRIAQRAAGTPHLESVLLGGSLGRGEATTVSDASGERLASDVEIYLVGRSASLRSAARLLADQLQDEEAGSEISVAWIHPSALSKSRAKNLSWRPSRTIRLYELAAGSRSLVGPMPQIAPIDPATLPLAEGIRLILNRLVEASPAIAEGTVDAGRWVDKILMACGDTMLLAALQYTASYRGRAGRLADLAEPWTMPSGWRPMLLDAYERKLSGTAERRPSLGEVADLVPAALAPAMERVVGIELEPIGTFPYRYAMAAARNEEMLRYLPPLGPAASYEGIVVLARGLRAGRRLAPRALAQAVAGRPLSLVLQGVGLPLFNGLARLDNEALRAAADALRWAGVPSHLIAAAESPGALALLVCRYWQVAT